MPFPLEYKYIQCVTEGVETGEIELISLKDFKMQVLCSFTVMKCLSLSV